MKRRKDREWEIRVERIHERRLQTRNLRRVNISIEDFRIREDNGWEVWSRVNIFWIRFKDLILIIDRCWTVIILVTFARKFLSVWKDHKSQVSSKYLFRNSSDCWIKSEWVIFWNRWISFFNVFFKILRLIINSFRDKIRET